MNHGKHKTAFGARKITWFFEKHAPAPFISHTDCPRKKFRISKTLFERYSVLLSYDLILMLSVSLLLNRPECSETVSNENCQKEECKMTFISRKTQKQLQDKLTTLMNKLTSTVFSDSCKETLNKLACRRAMGLR